MGARVSRGAGGGVGRDKKNLTNWRKAVKIEIAKVKKNDVRCMKMEKIMEKIYKIAIDVMGSDNGPETMVKGALKALRANVDMGAVLVGDREAINTALAGAGAYDADRIEIIEAAEIKEGDSIF